MTKLVGARIAGRSHAASGTPCQDAVATTSVGNVHCIALADGAGSRAHSDHGAQLAVDSVTRYLARNFEKTWEMNDEAIADEVLSVVGAAHRRHVKRKDYDTGQLACTLMFAVHSNGRLLAGHLGDGLIAKRTAGEAKVLSLPDNGEHINTTTFVDAPLAAKRMRIYRESKTTCNAVMLMSDGTGESLYHRSTQSLAPAALTIFGWSDKLPVKKLQHVLLGNLEQVFSKKTGDDCSIALMRIL